MNGNDYWDSNSVFITVMFMGTYLLPLENAFRVSGGYFTRLIPFPLLQTSDLKVLASHVRDLCKIDPTNDHNFWWHLLSFGGWPRPTAKFLSAVKGHISTELPWDVFIQKYVFNPLLSKQYLQWSDSVLPQPCLYKVLTTSFL